MEILVLVKPVPEPETRLRPSADGTDLDRGGIKWVLAGYDESAVEQALLLKESVAGSKVRAISFGPGPHTEEVLRACLALGCDAATWIERPAQASVDPLTAARVLALVVKRYPFDLVLAGKQAGDDEMGVVAPAVGELLGIPDYQPVVDLRWEAAGGRFTFQRAVDGGLDGLAVAGPLVIGLQQAWNDPRTARLPNILKSRKIPIDKVPAAEVAEVLGSSAATAPRALTFRLPAPRTGAKMIEYRTPEEAAQKLVKILKEEAKVLP
jgi:electron transfer flavoprotein beta subunit